MPKRQRKPAQQRSHRGHHDRAETQQAGLKDGFVGSLTFARSTASAKSIIMIAFFFTMPIRRMMPISAITLRSVLVMSNARMRQRRPTAA